MSSDYADAGDYDEHGQAIHLGTVLKRSELSSLPRIEPLIEGIISTPAVVVLVGGYGVGKTFLALSMANSVGTGHPWLGRRVERRRVLYVTGEGAYGLDDRVAAWEAAWGQDVADDDVRFVVQPDSLTKASTWQALTEFARDGDYRFAIFDTFSSLAPNADETKDAPMIMRRLGDLAASIEGTTLLVHHPGWADNSRTRGGYQLEGNPDDVLVATEVARGSEVFTLTRKKVKDGPDGQVLYLRRAPAHGSCVIEETRADEAGIPLSRRVLLILTNYGEQGATGPQLMDECEVDGKARSTFYRTLQRLEKGESIRKEGPDNHPRYYIAEVVP